MIDRLLTLSARRPALALGLLAAVTIALAIAAAVGTETRFEIEDFFPAEGEERATYERTRSLFGRDDRTAVVVLEAERELGVAELGTIAALTGRLRDREELEEVISPTSAFIVVRRDDDRLWLERAIPASGPTPERVARVMETFSKPPYLNSIVSEDRRVAVVGCVLREDRTSFPDRRALRDALEVERPALEAAGFRVRIAGYPIQRVVLVETVGRDTRLIFPLVVVAILIVLAVTLRRPIPTVAPLVVVLIATVWTLGLMAVTGLAVTVVTLATLVMVAVVSVADSVHVLARFAELRALGRAPNEAVRATLEELGRPLFLTSLTTAVVFATQMLTGIPLVAGFGLQVALGVAAAWLATMLFVPPALVLGTAVAARLGRAELLVGGAPKEVEGGWSTRAVLAVDRLVVGRPAVVVAGFAALVLLAIIPLRMVRVNSPFLSDLDPDHPLRETSTFLNDRMGGVIPVDVIIEPPPETADDPMAPYRRKRIDRVASFVQRLRADDDIIRVSSAVDVLQQMGRLLEKVPREERTGLMPTALLVAQDEVRRWVHDGEDVMRVHLFIRDVDTDDAFRLFGRIRDAYELELGESSEGRITGQGYLGQLVNQRMVEHFGTGFALAILAVCAIVAVAFRSLRIAVIALAPNLFPVVMVAATMGVLGIDLNYTAALVLSVVFGLAVDDSIHYLASYRELRRHHEDPVGETTRRTAAGLVLTSLVLATGFIVMGASEFLANRVLGLLLALTAGFALAGDLLLLPALLRLSDAHARPSVARPGSRR